MQVSTGSNKHSLKPRFGLGFYNSKNFIKIEQKNLLICQHITHFVDRNMFVKGSSLALFVLI